MILQSARDYLAAASNIRTAHLVQIELAGSAPNTYSYATDYLSDLTVNGITYSAGRVISVGSVKLTKGLTNYTVSVTVPGEYQDELDKATTNLSYEGRRLNIFKVYIDEGGQVITMTTTGPLVWFQGKITSVALSDNLTSGAAKVTFSCAGLLADFEKVNGRVTDDAAHRGLVSGGLLPVPSAGAKRVAYQTDLGFQHANQTISTNISYLAKEKQYKLKKSWGGLKTKLKEVEVEVEKELDLKSSLEAKYLPIVYGVRKVPGIPVFLDVLKSDPSKMVCVYAFCEGEVQSFLNVYVNGVSAICGPGGSDQESAVCMGNMEAGDTLGMYSVSGRSTERHTQLSRSPFKVRNPEALADFSSFNTASTLQARSGTIHGQEINVLVDEGPIRMQFFHGKPDQAPAASLVTIASFNNFLVQSTTTKPDGSPWGQDYWPPAGTNFSGAALLDTAYIVTIFDISDSRTSLPEIEAVIQGRACRVYTTESVFTTQQTLNPVWHLLDYLINPTFGGGLSIQDIDLPSFISCAQKLDVQDESYDASFVTMWRYVGWDSPTGNRSVMQCNTLLASDQPVTKLAEGLLNQFNGSLVPVQGKYVLSVESDDPSVATIDISDTIGSIRINSKANKDKWNSLQATIQDPALGWGANQISFFDSGFLSQDNGIRKQGRAAFEHITNYYTARSWAQFLLNSSRFSKKVEITTYYKFFELKPNDNVIFNYARYGFLHPNNKFRVAEVQAQPDGLINLTLESYDSSVFLKSQQSKAPTPDPSGPPIAPPQNLLFTALPNPGVLVSVEEGFIGGVVHWAVGGADVLHWELIIYKSTGGVAIQDTPVAVVNNTQVASVFGTSKIFFLMPLEANTTYEVKVQAVSLYGERSPFSIVTFATGAVVSPAIVPTVKNFTCTNADANKIFSGPSAVFTWDAVNPSNTTSVTLQLIDPTDSTVAYQQTFSPAQTSFTLSLDLNKASYFSNKGVVGAYRRLYPRIRASFNAINSEWSEIS